MGTKNTLLLNTFCVFFVLKNEKLFLKTFTKHALFFAVILFILFLCGGGGGNFGELLEKEILWQLEFRLPHVLSLPLFLYFSFFAITWTNFLWEFRCSFSHTLFLFLNLILLLCLSSSYLGWGKRALSLPFYPWNDLLTLDDYWFN